MPNSEKPAQFNGRKRVRKFYGDIPEVIDMPNLIEVQMESYAKFLMIDEPEGGRPDEGLQAVFNRVFPIMDFTETALLNFIKYKFEPPKHDMQECLQRGLTYSAPLKVVFQLISFDVDEETGRKTKTPREFKEQEVSMGDMPLMTPTGTFIFNGTERAVVSQMHRSPGVFFDHDKGKTHPSGKKLYSCRVIPYRGSWLDVLFDPRDIIHARIDRRNKFHITTLLMALGLDGEDIMNEFYEKVTFKRDGENKWRVSLAVGKDGKSRMPYIVERFHDSNLAENSQDIADAKSGKVILKAGEKSNAGNIRRALKNGTKEIVAPNELILNCYLAQDIVNMETGEINFDAGTEIDETVLAKLAELGVKEIEILDIDQARVYSHMRDTLVVDKNQTKKESLLKIYSMMRPGEQEPKMEKVKEVFRALFFDRERYDLSKVGRYKMGMRLDLSYKKVTFKRIGHNDWSVPIIRDESYKGEKWRLPLVIERFRAKNEGKSVSDAKTGKVILEGGAKGNSAVISKLAQSGLREIRVANEAIFKCYLPNDIVNEKTGEVYFEADSEITEHMVSKLGELGYKEIEVFDIPDMRVLRREDIIEAIKTLVDLHDNVSDADDIDNLGNRRIRSVGELMENHYYLGILRMERAIRERMANLDINTAMPQDLVNSKPAISAVREFFGMSQLSQFMDQTNPLSEITHKRRISSLGPGGLTRERAGFEVRDVHTTHYGRICPIETPEGPNIGLINSLATFARVNKYGLIESPYRKVENGRATSEVEYLSSIEEDKYKVAQANAELDKSNKFVNDLIITRHKGQVAMKAKDSVEYMDVSPKQLVSVAASLIPFLENDDANRALMGSNMMRQAVPLLRTESPFVGTGMEATVARDSGAAVIAKRAGVVDQVDATRIVVRADTRGLDASTSTVDIYRLKKFQRSNQNTCINQRPLVNVGDTIGAGDIIADGPATDLGDLALGKNVLVAFMPWNGYNFEDSILLSERIVRDDVFTSIHIEEFEVVARDTKQGPEDITRDIPNVSEEMLNNLDESGITYIGAQVHPGDILVGKITPKGESPMTPEEKLLRAIFGEKASDVRDTSLRMGPSGVGTVVDVRVFNRHGIEKDERAMAIEREEIATLAKDRDDEQAIHDRNIYARLREMLKGSVAVSGPKGFGRKTKLNDEVLEKYPRSQWWNFALESEKAQGQIEALKQQYDEAKKRLDAIFMDRVEKLQRGDELPATTLKMVKVFVAVKRKLQPGDKMAGRHGNKGVVSRIMPIEDMPFLEDGTHADIVLNPLGVPSRMNVGQILETHLGWACAGMGYRVGELLEEYYSGKKEKNSKPLRKLLESIYPNNDRNEPIRQYDEKSIINLAQQLKNGVRIATPVFDGATEKDVVEMLEQAGFDKSGQSVLYDGRTGEPFERTVTVGYIYMLKLHHLADDKIHSRSIGPYSLVTQQPLGGKAQFGGQRFGEMEVWALEAYGAAYTLQEMLTIKSDDVGGRTKVYESIVRGDDTFESGIPESFNVLVKEIRSLGLSVDLENSKSEYEVEEDEQSELEPEPHTGKATPLPEIV